MPQLHVLGEQEHAGPGPRRPELDCRHGAVVGATGRHPHVDDGEVGLVLGNGRTQQHRIADCLTSLDTFITAATQELETLKTHKKGLMQQLFPSAEVLEA